MADDGISWLFELDGETSGAEKILNVLGSLDTTVKKLDQSLNILKQGSHSVGEAHKAHGQEVQKTTGFIHGLIAAFKPLEERMAHIGGFEFIREGMEKILEIPGELIDKIKDLGVEMLNVAAEAEEMTITFKALFGAEDGERLLDYADELSAKTGILNDQWKGIEQTLGNAGFKIGPDMERAASAIADLGALSGHGAAGAEEAAHMFSTLQSLGEIHPRMLARFGLNVGDFWTELSRQTHKGVATLKKDMDKGKVDIEFTKAAIEQLIVRKTHKGLGGLGADVGEDMMTRIRRFQNLPKLLFEGLKDTSGYKSIGDTLGRAFNALNPKGESGKKIFEGLASAFARVGNAIGAIDWPEVAGEIGKVIDVVGIFIAGGIAFTDQLVRGFSRVIDIFTSAPDDFSAFSAAWTSVGENLLAANAWLGEKMVGLGKALWMGLLDGLAGGVTSVLDAVGNLGGAVVDKLKSVLGIHSPSLVFKGMGVMTTRGYAMGVEEESERARAAVASMSGADTPSIQNISTSSAVSRQGGTVQVSVSVPVVVHGGERGGDSIGDEIATRLRSILPTALTSAMEQLALEGGG